MDSTTDSSGTRAGEKDERLNNAVADGRSVAPTAEAVASSHRSVEQATLQAAVDGPVTRAYRDELAGRADRYGRGGMLLIAIAVLLTVALLITTWIATAHYVEDLNNAGDPTEMLVLLLARGTAFGAAGTALIVALLLFARACMDQSARFRVTVQVVPSWVLSQRR
jgi:hypothetical protein